MLYVNTRQPNPLEPLLSAPAGARGRAEGTQCPEFCSTASPACEEQHSLTAPRSKRIRYVEISFNPKNAHVAQSGLWEKKKNQKNQTKPKKKSHTLNLCFSSFKRLIPTRGAKVSANSPSVLTCLHGLHLQKGEKNPTRWKAGYTR